MDYLRCNTIYPPLSEKEIADFISAPDPVDEVPEIFKDAVKFIQGPIVKIDFTFAPSGLTKKEYELRIRETKKDIEIAKKKVRELQNAQDETINYWWAHGRLEDLIEYEKNLKKRVANLSVKHDGSRLEAAKRIPIDSLVEVRHGFARCPKHQDKTPSMKYYPKENRFHCFSCGLDGDPVDLVMAINSITMPEALKLLVRA